MPTYGTLQLNQYGLDKNKTPSKMKAKKCSESMNCIWEGNRYTSELQMSLRFKGSNLPLQCSLRDRYFGKAKIGFMSFES